MSVRAGMANLISRVRLLIADTTGTPQFSDQVIQDKLDEYRTEHRQERLTAQFTVQPGGRRLWTHYYSDYEQWEEPDGTDQTASFVLQDASYNVLQADKSDYIAGKWVFNSGVNNGVLWLTGQSFDINAAAADLAQDWAAALKLRFAFTDQGVGYQRQQQYQMLMDLSQKVRQRANPRCVKQVRTDVPRVTPATGFFTDVTDTNGLVQ